MKISLLTCVCFLFNITAFSQKFSASLDIQMSVPQGEYKTLNPDAGIGGRGNFFYRPQKNIPVKVGLELGMQVKGSTHQYFSSYYDNYRVTASNNIFSLMFAARFQQEKEGKIKPFLDAIAGWNVFYSTVNIEQLTFFSPYDASYSNSSKARWAFTYGAAAGIDVPLNKRDDIGLELKCAYLFGSDTDYLTDPKIANDGQVYFREARSTTDMIIPQIGVRISIR